MDLNSDDDDEEEDVSAEEPELEPAAQAHLARQEAEEDASNSVEKAEEGEDAAATAATNASTAGASEATVTGPTARSEHQPPPKRPGRPPADTTRKPTFACPVEGCDKAYTTNSGLYQHKRSKHPEKIKRRVPLGAPTHPLQPTLTCTPQEGPSTPAATAAAGVAFLAHVRGSKAAKSDVRNTGQPPARRAILPGRKSPEASPDAPTARVAAAEAAAAAGTPTKQARTHGPPEGVECPSGVPAGWQVIEHVSSGGHAYKRCARALGLCTREHCAPDPSRLAVLPTHLLGGRYKGPNGERAQSVTEARRKTAGAAESRNAPLRDDTPADSPAAVSPHLGGPSPPEPATSSDATAPGWQRIGVKVPPGMSPGDEIQFPTPQGMKYKTVIPPGITSGNVFLVEVPVRQPAVTVTCKPEEVELHLGLGAAQQGWRIEGVAATACPGAQIEWRYLAPTGESFTSASEAAAAFSATQLMPPPQPAVLAAPPPAPAAVSPHRSGPWPSAPCATSALSGLGEGNDAPQEATGEEVAVAEEAEQEDVEGVEGVEVEMEEEEEEEEKEEVEVVEAEEEAEEVEEVRSPHLHTPTSPHAAHALCYLPCTARGFQARASEDRVGLQVGVPERCEVAGGVPAGRQKCPPGHICDGEAGGARRRKASCYGEAVEKEAAWARPGGQGVECRAGPVG